MQISGGEIRAKVGAVSPDRAVIHEPIFEKHLLSGDNVGLGKERFSGWPDDGFRDGRGLRIRLGGQPNEDGKAANQGQNDRMSPPGRERLQAGGCGVHGWSPLGVGAPPSVQDDGSTEIGQSRCV